MFLRGSKARPILTVLGLILLVLILRLMYTNCFSARPEKLTANNCQVGKVSNSSSRGYAIALHFWEQAIHATHNLLALQCWAARHDLRVVAPVVRSSSVLRDSSGPRGGEWSLSFFFNRVHPSLGMELENFFDMDDWTMFAREKGLAPLVSREEFLRDVSLHKKNVILVQLHYQLHSCKAGPCRCNWYEPDLNGMRQIENLKVVRQVCINNLNGIMSVENFDKKIYGDLCPHDSVVIFDDWRGIARPRVYITLDCNHAQTYSCHIPFSPRLINDAASYANEHLGGFGQYNAVMARFEKTKHDPFYNTMEQNHLLLNEMVDKTIAKWKEMRERTSTSATFLAFDYGSFGSDSFRTKHFYNSKERLEEFHRLIYDGTMSVQEWEHSFMQTCQTNHSVYIALLQMQLVSHANCVLFVGIRSNFLSHALNSYQKIHPDNRCIDTIGDIHSPYCAAYGEITAHSSAMLVICSLLIFVCLFS